MESLNRGEVAGELHEWVRRRVVLDLPENYL